jgi:hypothetical protein
MKTSLNDPLRIAEVSSPSAPGVIGLTLCPGKKDRESGWNRDLETDIAAIRDWGAEVIVSLIETWEFDFLVVTNLPRVVERERRFRDEAPTSAAEAATIILDGVKADRWRILVGEDAHRLDERVRQSPERAYDVDFFESFARESGWRVGS